MSQDTSSVSGSVRSGNVGLVIIPHGNVNRFHTNSGYYGVHQLHPQFLVLDVAVLHRDLEIFSVITPRDGHEMVTSTATMRGCDEIDYIHM